MGEWRSEQVDLVYLDSHTGKAVKLSDNPLIIELNNLNVIA